MAPTTPTGPPVQVVAGDSWRWKVSDLSNYPQSEGWSLKYELSGKSKTLTITPTWQTSGDDANYWLVAVATTETVDLDAGVHILSARVVGSGTYSGREEAIDVRTGCAISTPLPPWYVNIIPDPRTAAAGDSMLTLEQDIEKLRDAIGKRLSKQDESYSINGRSISKIPYREMESMLSQKVALRSSILTRSIGRAVEVRFGRA